MLPRHLSRALNDTANPYLAARTALIDDFYPTPSSGFDARLLTLIGLCAYLFVVTCVFLGLYSIGLKRQGKKFWGWRLVRKSEGRYIAANIYVASIVPILFVTPLIGALIGNNRMVFVERGSQIHTFLWRTLVWVVVWLQGWVSTFANVQAVLITSPKQASRRLPTIVNSIYIAVPTVCGIGLLVPALLCSFSWDYVIRRFEETIVLLDQAAASYDPIAPPNAVLMRQIGATRLLLEHRLEVFFTQYLALLLVWTCASIVLVSVNIAGVVLILRLRTQIKFNAENSFGLPTPTRVSADQPTSIIQLVPSNMSVDEKTLVDDGGSIASGGGRMRSPQPYSNRVHRRVASPSGARTEHRRAMEKLVRDLCVTTFGVTLLALVFAADTILLAVVRYTLYVNWVTTEIGVTMIIWAYVSVLCIGMSLLSINEAIFLFSPAANSFSDNALSVPTSGALSSKPSPVEFVKLTHVSIDIASPRDQRHQAREFAAQGRARRREYEGQGYDGESELRRMRSESSWTDAEAYTPQVGWQTPLLKSDVM